MEAKKIDNFKVVLGQMIKVQNQKQKNLQNNYYIAVQVQDQNGQNQRCLLFTEIQLSDMTKINSQFLMNNMVAGRIYSFSIGKQNLYLVKLTNRIGITMIYRLTKKRLQFAQKRALKNPQDLTKKSWLTDIAD